ncbi:MAG TPA: M28 family peptidase [Bacteroidota bacterium]|nr:M28 family peptidase [Bacteroidota bacterium]
MKRLFFCFFPIALAAAQSIDPNALQGYQSLQTSALYSRLSVLTADSLEGREISYPGQRKAARFIAQEFQKFHLKPIGDNGTYFQHFNVTATGMDSTSTIVAAIGNVSTTYHWGKDFIGGPTFDTTVSGKAAFIGYTDTELDDVAKEKLSGRILFVFIGKRRYADDTSRAMLLQRLFALRRETSAAAMLMVTDDEGTASFLPVRSFLWNTGADKLAIKMPDTTKPVQQLSIRFIVSSELAQSILQGSGTTLQQLRSESKKEKIFAPLFLDNVTVTVNSKSIHELRQTENVVGLLEGSDPILKNEAVVISAHHDHLGKDLAGNIYHGADDDGSGTTSLMDLAEAFAKNPVKPKRSILFLSVTGEEKGLFGSSYYTDHPLVPLQQTFTDLNIDMIGRTDDLHQDRPALNYVYVIGSDKISPQLDSLLNAANKESEHIDLDYKYNDENDPEQYYRRSDHYNFAKHNVPVVFFFTGNHKDYHKPTDTIEKIQFDKMLKIDHLIYDLAWKLANLDHPLVKPFTH